MSPCRCHTIVPTSVSQQPKKWRSAPKSLAPGCSRYGQKRDRDCIDAVGDFLPQAEEVDNALEQLEKAAAEMHPDHSDMHADSCMAALSAVPCKDVPSSTDAFEPEMTPAQPLQLRRTWHQLHGSKHDRLSRAQLRDVLAASSTAHVSVEGVSLGSSVLDHAVLEHCRFQQADMERVSLRGAQIRKTSFFAANLRYAVFDDASLANVDFTGADLTGASFLGCDPAAFLDSIAWYGACLHNVTWPNVAVAQQMKHRSLCRCNTSRKNNGA